MVELFAFRGIGFNIPDPQPLINAGHVGVRFSQEPVIYGFHPTPESLAELVRQGIDPIAFLKSHGTLPGMVYDDTDIFIRAATLARTHDGRTQVWRCALTGDVARARQTLALQRHNASALWYRFPASDGTPMDGAWNNCATWPRTLGLHILEPSGSIRRLMALVEQIGQPWEVADD